MVKLVDMPDLGSGAARRVGSSPIIRTLKTQTFNLQGFAFFIFNSCQTIAKLFDKINLINSICLHLLKLYLYIYTMN